MKVCIPVKENKGGESTPYNHFGSAPCFIIYDTDSKEIKTIENGDLNHAHGMCQPLKALSGEKVDVVLVEGIGAGAINKLKRQGIKVCKAVGGTIEENIKLLKEDKLAEFSINNICSNHDCHH